MRTRILLIAIVGALVLSAVPARAQQSEKRSEVELLPVGPPAAELAPRGWGLYDFHTTLQVGGQIANIHGNNEVYRSQLNYSDGFRVFGFRFEGKANNPAAFFTRMFMEGGGWGGDPYNWLRYGLSKDRWFDFRVNYQRSDYFYFFPGWARNQRLNDQQRRRQSFEVTLFPQRKVRFRLGYFRNSSFGPTLTSNDIENTRDVFPLFEPLRQTSDEYLIGADWNIQHWSFFFDYSWRHFRNDRFLDLVTPPVPNPGNLLLPANAAFQSRVERAYPGRGHIPFVRFTLTGRPHRTFDVSARLVYSRAKFDFTRIETNTGRTFDPFGAPPAVDFSRTWANPPLTDIRRPNTLADIAVTWRPGWNLTFSNTFRFNGFDIAGASLINILTQQLTGPVPSPALSPPPGSFGEFFANLFDVDYFMNRFEVRYDPVRWLGLRAGHRHTHRDANVLHAETECEDAFLPACTGGTLIVEPDEREPGKRVANVLLLGGDFRPHSSLKLFVDYERGGIDSVFNRIRRGHRTTARVRARWEPRQGYRFSAAYARFDLRVPEPLVDSNQRNRSFTIDFSLTRWQRFYWDVGYARNDVSSFTDISRLIGGVFRLVDGPTGVDCTETPAGSGNWLRNTTLNLPCRPSTYIDNNNYAYFDLGGRLVGNLHGEIGYRVSTATGTYLPSDPEGACPLVFFGPCNVYPTLPVIGTVRVEWGGMNYHQPHASLEYVFSDNVRWKTGWRWYGYNLKQGTASDYKAHIVTTSMVLSF